MFRGREEAQIEVLSCLWFTMPFVIELVELDTVSQMEIHAMFSLGACGSINFSSC